MNIKLLTAILRIYNATGRTYICTDNIHTTPLGQSLINDLIQQHPTQARNIQNTYVHLLANG